MEQLMEQLTLRARWLAWGVSVVFCLTFLAAATPAAAHGGIPNVIHSCVKKTGEVRFVHPDATCGKDETPKDWVAA